MPIWIIYALLAYFLLALNGIADKFLLTKVVHKPVVYAFFLGIVSPVAFVLWPLGLHMLPIGLFMIALLSGLVYIFALYFLYSAIQHSAVSRVLPLEGGLVPVFTLLLAITFLHETFTASTLAAFAFLVGGAILISFEHIGRKWKSQELGHAVLAAALFAVSFVLAKHVYSETNFISGLLWSRLGLFLGALIFLATKGNRNDIMSALKKTSTDNKILFYSSHIMGASGVVLQNLAIATGSVTIVNALQGVQFAFILLLGVVLSVFFPKILKENASIIILFQKVVAIILISSGLFILSI